MARKATDSYAPKPHRKKTRQGCGLGTKFGTKRGNMKKYRGQGGRKSIKH